MLEEGLYLLSVRCYVPGVMSDADTIIICTAFNTPRFEFLSDPLQHRQQRHTEQCRADGVPLLHPTGAVYFALSTELIWKNTRAGLSPKHLHLVTNGVSVGTQVAASASPAVSLTVLKALEQSVFYEPIVCILVVHPGA